MSTTQQRLDAYLAAEARILAGGQELRYDLRQKQEAELAEIRKAIEGLQRQLAVEQGRGSLNYRTAVFCGR